MIRNFQNIKKGLFPYINSGYNMNNDDAKEKTSETTLEPAAKHQKTSGEYFLGSMIQT